MHSTGLEPEDLTSSESRGAGILPLIALIVSVIGIIFGLAGMYMATQSSKALSEYQKMVADRPDPNAERLKSLGTDLSAKVDDINGRLGSMGTSIVRLQRQDQAVNEQSQKAFDQVSAEISANREKLGELATKLESMGTSRVAASTKGASVATASDASDTKEARSLVSEGTYLVVSGDTMSGIAKRHGVPLSALMAANPSVDPRRMHLGQEIIIPKN